MKRYEYVPLKIGRLWTDYVELNGEHRRIIDEYAERGYRYTGFIPTGFTSYGRIVKADLIFEKVE